MSDKKAKKKVKLKLPYWLNVAGHSRSLYCTSLNSEYGHIQNGIVFQFEGEGSWVIDRQDLEKIVLAAKNQ